ncbi:ComEA family DNA-binding protein [Pseudanabaena sp. FACHB-2040]|uniref:helix-hairpin-helix domain-containing protein n=1 Tax=Pseudanabaena sp. FACHB-2040 TaxID=2692859 RepID=UPI0016894C81|nr:ComEA family DNA-binding protein [Pseudanabaena sp. FACHB-2040]MBD0268726.1 ComEA family DNA-binding protein [Cyanobacteria bacterium Co-bin8]MBD2256300.1 ComEA family DNA-binding protein [Pseudanabaena sp. FACHB-2040]
MSLDQPKSPFIKLRGQLNPLRQRLQSDPYCRLQSYQEVKLAAELGFCLDVNRATVDDWLRLPGLSIHQARSLVSLSHAGVAFHCLEDVAAALGMPPAALTPLLPVLDFRYYDPAEAAGLVPVRVNQATVDDLCQVPRIDPQTARAIIYDRNWRGPFQNAAEFQQRLHVPPDWMAHLIHYLRF